jgi:hypothetical protein
MATTPSISSPKQTRITFRSDPALQTRRFGFGDTKRPVTPTKPFGGRYICGFFLNDRHSPRPLILHQILFLRIEDKYVDVIT